MVALWEPEIVNGGLWRHHVRFMVQSDPVVWTVCWSTTVGKAILVT
jgi:hypothetical protein